MLLEVNIAVNNVIKFPKYKIQQDDIQDKIENQKMKSIKNPNK